MTHTSPEAKLFARYDGAHGADTQAASAGPVPPTGQGRALAALADGAAVEAADPATRELLLQRALTIAAQAEAMLADQRARIAQLEEIAMTDELTGLCNRRGFFSHFRRALAQCRRHGHTGAVVIFDLDGFKAVNDQLGHTAGDRLLAAVGEGLRARTRDMDVVARLGGDEFAVLMPQADPEAARRRAEEMCDALGAALCGCPEIRGLAVSTSYGIAGFEADSEPETVLARADARMYADKPGRGGPG